MYSKSVAPLSWWVEEGANKEVILLSSNILHTDKQKYIDILKNSRNKKKGQQKVLKIQQISITPFPVYVFIFSIGDFFAINFFIFHAFSITN